MKYIETKPELCVGCKKCVEVCSSVLFKSKTTEKSAIMITKIGEAAYDINVCNQCGSCIQICPVQAIYRAKNGSILINKDKCVGCLACVGFCPIDAMRYDNTTPFKCIACGSCAKQCPTGAIFIKQG